MSSMPGTSTSDSSGAASKNSVTVQKLANDYWMGTTFLVVVGVCLLALTCGRLASTSFLLALFLFTMAVWTSSLTKKMKKEEVEKAAAELKVQKEATARRVAEEKAAAEFAAKMTTDREAAERRMFDPVFDEIDTSEDGKASRRELRTFVAKDPRMASQLGIANVEKFIKEADEDGDGEVSREEFLACLAKGKGKEQHGKNHCWDFDSGYCSRGSDCPYKHDVAMAVDQAEMDYRFQACADCAVAHGVNLSSEALNELKTLSIEDAETIITSLGSGGAYEQVKDKNRHVIINIRRMRRRSASDANPDWHLSNSLAKRPRYG